MQPLLEGGLQVRQSPRKVEIALSQIMEPDQPHPRHQVRLLVVPSHLEQRSATKAPPMRLELLQLAREQQLLQVQLRSVLSVYQSE